VSAPGDGLPPLFRRGMSLPDWRKHYAARSAAAVAVKTAMKSGRLPRPTACCVCGKTRERSGRAVSYHHHSYAPDDRLNVRPVCGSCHSRIHAGILPEPATGALRSPSSLAFVR
jgi:hypothetical protein